MICIMAQRQGGALPSSQGGLVMYMDADTGIDVDPKTVIATSVSVGMVTIAIQSQRIMGIFI